MFRRRRFTSGRVKTKRRQVIFDVLLLFLALVGAIVLLLSQVSMLRILTVRELDIQGNEDVPTRVIENIVRRELSGYYLGLFSRSNTFLFSRDRIVDSLLATSDRISSVDVDLESFNEISVQVFERESVGVWCQGSFGNARNCYFLDQAGFLYARAPTFSSSIFLEFYGDITSKNPIGKTYLEDLFFDVYDFVDTVEGSGVSVSALSVVSSEQFELHVEEGARIIFDPNNGYDSLLENLSLVLSSNEFRTEASDNRLLLIDYIDLRFGNKVFYKFQ